MASCIIEIFEYIDDFEFPITSHTLPYNGDSVNYQAKDVTGLYYYRLPSMMKDFSLESFKAMLTECFVTEHFAGINRIVEPVIKRWDDTVAYDHQGRVVIKIGNFITAKKNGKKSKV